MSNLIFFHLWRSLKKVEGGKTFLSNALSPDNSFSTFYPLLVWTLCRWDLPLILSASKYLIFVGRYSWAVLFHLFSTFYNWDQSLITTFNTFLGLGFNPFVFETKMFLLSVHVCLCVPPGRDGEYFPPLQNIFSHFRIFPPLQNISAGECFRLIREILIHTLQCMKYITGEVLITAHCSFSIKLYICFVFHWNTLAAHCIKLC